MAVAAAAEAAAEAAAAAAVAAPMSDEMELDMPNEKRDESDELKCAGHKERDEKRCGKRDEIWSEYMSEKTPDAAVAPLRRATPVEEVATRVEPKKERQWAPVSLFLQRKSAIHHA